MRVDILSAFGTLTFRKAWNQRVEARFGHYDRPQDRVDVQLLLRVAALSETDQ